MAATPLTIGLDASPLNHPFFCGIQRYLTGLLKGFYELELNHQLLLMGVTDPLNFPLNHFQSCGPALPSGHGGWMDSVFSFLGHVNGVDLLFRAWGTLPERRSCPGVLVVHDVIPLIYPEFACNKGVVDFFNNDFRQKLPYVDAIITVSEQTKLDFLHFYNYSPERVHVVSHGVDDRFLTLQLNDFPLCVGSVTIDRPYILSVGVVEPRKNYQRLIKAYELMRHSDSMGSFPLVIVGSLGWGYESVLETVAVSPFKNDIFILGAVEECLLHALYGNAAIFIYPSLYEGFGLPLLEAMAAGKACIAGQHSALKEVGGDAVLYADISDIESIAEKMAFLLLNDELKKSLEGLSRLRASNFTWKKTALETMDVFRYYGG